MRLIDADALIECLQTWKTAAVSEGLPINERFAVAMIAQVNLMPTIEPERKPGEWIYDGDCYICNQCKSAFNWWADSQTSNYCPNCGADMRGEQDE